MHLCDNQYYTSFQKTLVLLFFVCFIGLLFSFLDLNYKPVFAQVFEFPEADYFEFDDDNSDSIKKERKENIETYNKKALEFIESGQYEKAIEYYEKILDIDSQNHEALTQKQKLENQIQQNKNIQQQDQNTFNDTTEAKISTNNSPIIRYDTQLNTTINIPKKIKLNTVDREGNKLTTTIIALPKYGSLKSDDQTNTGNNNNNIVTYTPDTNFVGIDSFILKIDNGKRYYENRVIVNIQDLNSLENKRNKDIKSSNLTTNEKNTSSSVLDTVINTTLQTQKNTAKKSISNETSINKKNIIPTKYVFEKKWGMYGSNDGQFLVPGGIAIDNENNIFIMDSHANTIQKFNSDGNFITKWYTFEVNDADSSSPEGIAVDNEGFVYVTDYPSLKKYTSDGQFVTSWGEEGEGDGHLSSPEGIAIDNEGFVYVTDVGNVGNDNIQKFTSDGQFVTSWGEEGEDDGQISDSYGIAVDNEGFVYVTDYLSSKVKKYTSDGQFVTSWGEEGEGDGQFINPYGIAVDNEGFVYVTDVGNDNIQKYTSDGQFVTRWGEEGKSNGQLRDPRGIALDSNGKIYVTEWLNTRVQVFKPSILEVVEKNTSSILDKNNNTVNNILPIQNNTATRFISNETSIDKKEILDTKYVFEKKLGNGDNEVGSLSIPLSVAIDSQNAVYVSDYGNDNIQKFDSNGTFITSWGESGSKKGQFEYADGIAADNNNNVYVSDSENNNIQKFDSNGKFITSWGKYGSKDGQFMYPEGIAVDNNNNVYVSDNLNDRIQKFDSNGKFITSWSESENEEGQIIAPEGIAIDSQNAVYVVDSGNDRIQKFDSNGKFITSWGESGTGEGQFNFPQGLAIDSQNAVYVVDSGNDRIQKFDSNGKFITSWGESGTGEGQLIKPDDIAVDKNGFVFVVESDTDNESYRIQIFKPMKNLQQSESNKSYSSLSSPNLQSDKIINKNPEPVVKVSETLQFTGENYEELPESEDINIDSFTISLWFNTNHNTGKHWKSMRDNYDFLLNKGGIGSDKPGYNLVYGIFITYENKISGGFETITGDDYYVTSSEAYNDGKWHNAILTFDEKSHMLKLYIDRKEISNNPIKAGVKPDITGNGPIRLGANSLVHGGKITDYYNGQLDDIKIWNYAFTKEQVSNLFDIESNIDR